MKEKRGLDLRRDVLVDQNKKELMEYPAADFPCKVLYSDMTKYSTKTVPWHWHPGIELFAVKSGAVQFGLETGEFVFGKGEGGFVNQNILHATEIAGSAGCELQTFIFSPDLFTGGEKGELYRRIESTLGELRHVAFIPLNQNEPWKKEVLKCMEEAYTAYCEESVAGEMLLIEKMLHIWRLLIQNGSSLSGTEVAAPNVQTQVRLKQMLEYIHAHYADPVTLDDIAGAAGISGRECTRTFQNGIRMSPVAYLIKYRIGKAQELLCAADLSVTEVGIQSGFNNSSYFARIFRRYTGVTPKKYQQMNPTAMGYDR